MTVISDSATVLAGEDALESSFRHRISWSSIFVGAVVGTATIFLLLTLGAGVGLSLVHPHQVASRGFLTLGAIYFLAAQAMGFAVGGHLVGRLIGPMAETDREEEFRAAAHGLAVWGLCVSVTAILVLMSGWVAAGSGAMASAMALNPSNTNTAPAPAVTAYWTDVLFRPATTPMQGALSWPQYAQAATSATDASPATDDESQSSPQSTTTRMTPVPNNAGRVENDTQSAPGGGAVETRPPASPTAPHVITIPAEGENVPTTTAATSAGGQAAVPGSGGSTPADKAEVGRILEQAMLDGGTLSSYDRARVASLVAQDTGVSSTEAARRTDNALTRIRADQARAAEAARKISRNASLWIALALLFGAVVATMAAISARWEDDRITFGFSRRETA